MAGNRKTARRQAQRRGRRAEYLSSVMLNLKGYRIMARRFRCPVGEIDLIARRGAHYAFVEVKERKTVIAAREAINDRQKQRIVRAAETWLARAQSNGKLPVDYSTSFDAILVTPWKWPKHLKAAFDATM